MQDIVLVEGNEKEFISRAKELGFDKLVLVYDSLNQVRKVDESGIEIGYGILLKGNKKQLVRKIGLAKSKGLMVVVRAEDDSFNRFILERTKADMLFDLEYVHKKDAMHYRRSGLDQVLCKIAATKGKVIGVSFASFLESKNRKLALGRIKQNLRFCKKYKVKVWLGSLADDICQMRSGHDLKSFLTVLKQDF